MTSTAQAVLTRTQGPVVTRLVAQVYAYNDEYVLEVSAEWFNVSDGSHDGKTRHARYPAFDNALEDMDNGIFILTTQRGFVLDMYDSQIQGWTTQTESASHDAAFAAAREAERQDTAT